MAHPHEKTRLANVAVDNLQARLDGFVAELQYFKQHLLSLNKRPVIGLDRLLEAHEKALATSIHDKKSNQAARENLEFDSTLWCIVKQFRGLVAVKQNYRADWDFVLERPAETHLSMTKKQTAACLDGLNDSNCRQSRAEHVAVDAVVDAGATWIRLLTISERGLLFELADSGAWDFECDSATESDDEGSNFKSGHCHFGHDCDSIKTIRKVNAVVTAARNQRFKYRHPRVHILLPKLEEGKMEQIDRVIARMRQLGDDHFTVVVDCGNSTFLRGAPNPTPLHRILSTLVVDELEDISPTVNLDISWLIALTSDLSHERSSKPFASSLCLSVGDAKTPASIREACGRSLCETLYPTLAMRNLICTSSAAERVWAIARTLATSTELARLRLVLPETEDGRAAASSLGSHGIRTRLAKLSVHSVPDRVYLPVDIIDDRFTQAVGGLIASGQLPRVSPAVANELKEPNRSIFLFGWATGLTTLTANSAMVNRIKRTLELNRTGAHEVGPDVFMRWVTR